MGRWDEISNLAYICVVYPFLVVWTMWSVGMMLVGMVLVSRHGLKHSPSAWSDGMLDANATYPSAGAHIGLLLAAQAWLAAQDEVGEVA
jgi:hypothetical protein